MCKRESARVHTPWHSPKKWAKNNLNSSLGQFARGGLISHYPEPAVRHRGPERLWSLVSAHLGPRRSYLVRDVTRSLPVAPTRLVPLDGMCAFEERRSRPRCFTRRLVAARVRLVLVRTGSGPSLVVQQQASDEVQRVSGVLCHSMVQLMGRHGSGREQRCGNSSNRNCRVVVLITVPICVLVCTVRLLESVPHRRTRI